MLYHLKTGERFGRDPCTRPGRLSLALGAAFNGPQRVTPQQGASWPNLPVAPGHLIDVGGRNLHVLCSGSVTYRDPRSGRIVIRGPPLGKPPRPGG